MPNGPQVARQIPGGEQTSLLMPREDRVAAQAQREREQATSGFVGVVNQVYERVSGARATDAMNRIKSRVDDLLNGQDGALRKKGSEVVDFDKEPFSQYYEKELDKIYEQEIEKLDTYQKRLISGKWGSYRAQRSASLRDHAIKEFNTYESGVAKVQGESASEAIASAGGNREVIDENIADLRESLRILNPNVSPEELSSKQTAAISGALTEGIEIELANGNIAQAQGILSRYRSSMKPTDALKAQAKIKNALETAAKKKAAEEAKEKTVLAFTEGGMRKRAFEPFTGREFTAKEYDDAAKLAMAYGVPGIADQIYLIGQEKAKKYLDDWAKRVEEAKASGDRKQIESVISENPVASALTSRDRMALQELENRIAKARSTDEEEIRQAVIAENPNATREEVDKAVKEIKKDNIHAQAVRKVTTDQAAASLMRRMVAGDKWDDIPEVEKQYMTPAQRDGFMEYERRRDQSAFVNDSSLVWDLMSDNEKLKSLSWADLYSMAGRMRPNSFDQVVSLKQRLDAGEKVDDSLNIKGEVLDALRRIGVPAGQRGDAIRSRLGLVLYERINGMAQSNVGKGWDKERVRKEVASILSREYTAVGRLWDSDYSAKDLFSEKDRTDARGGTQAMIDAALKASGYPEPENLDRNEWLLSFIVNPIQPIQGADAFVQAAPSFDVAEARKAFQEKHPGREPTVNELARMILMSRFNGLVSTK